MTDDINIGDDPEIDTSDEPTDDDGQSPKNDPVPEEDQKENG